MSTTTKTVALTNQTETLISSALQVIIKPKHFHLIVREAATGLVFTLNPDEASPILNGSSGIYVSKDNQIVSINIEVSEYAVVSQFFTYHAVSDIPVGFAGTAQVGTQLYVGDGSGAQSKIVAPNNNGFISLQSFTGSTKNKTVWNTAVTAGSAKIAYVGHSIAAGNNQNFLGASTYNLLRRALKEAFPTVTMTFENFGIGGTIAAQFATTHPNTTISIPSINVYRESFQKQTAATVLTTNGSWAAAVAAFVPDLIFLQWDLNETSASAFATAMIANIAACQNVAIFTGKLPSIVLVSSHTGNTNTTVIRDCHKVLRGLAKQYQLPLIDAGRIYDILTTATDPYDLCPSVTGETNFFGQAVLSTNLNTAYYDSKIGTAFTSAGGTVRDAASGAQLRFYRTKLATNGANQQSAVTNTVNGIISLFYRADPTDPNYATGTGRQYELRITTTAVQVYYWPAGSAVAISGASLTLTNGIGTSTQFILRAEYKDSSHKITIYAPATPAEIQTLEFNDYQYMGAGYNGMGLSGNNGGWFNPGAIGNVSTGSVIEYWDNLPIGYPTYTDANLLGTVNDFSTNYASVGGNGINHLTNIGYKVVYEPALFSVIRQLQTS